MAIPSRKSSQLIQPLGNLYPERILWASMGTSASYAFFCGVMEIAAGLLLTIPRLATAGALLALADMVNVLMLNLGYDLKVKLTSINLSLMALVILLPQVGRLTDFLVLNRSVPAADEPPLFQRRSLARAAIALQLAFGIVLTTYNLYRVHQATEAIASARNTPLYGIWLVDDYVVRGQPITALSTDAHRWQRFIVEDKDNVVVQVMTGATNLLLLHSDPASNRIVLTQSGNPNWAGELSYDHSQPDRLVLNGKMGGVQVVLRLHHEDESQFPLRSRHFHWVNNGEF